MLPFEACICANLHPRLEHSNHTRKPRSVEETALHGISMWLWTPLYRTEPNTHDVWFEWHDPIGVVLIPVAVRTHPTTWGSASLQEHYNNAPNIVWMRQNRHVHAIQPRIPLRCCFDLDLQVVQSRCLHLHGVTRCSQNADYLFEKKNNVPAAL